ncbi:hypothetical protein ACA910_009338 [Epithemia clementina (nom. ined.)]
MTDYFDVPKGYDNIRMVDNGTSAGLNASLWAPSVWLPTAATALRNVSYYSYCVDMDLGEMFLNFPLDTSIRPYSGIDLRPVFPLLSPKAQGRGAERMRWNWNFMGLLPSPFNCIVFFYLAEEIILGPSIGATNPCRYDQIRFNLPGSSDYDPRLPWVMKWNKSAVPDASTVSKQGAIAGDNVTYVGYLRATGFSAENAWQVGCRNASRLKHLGIQDAP